MALSAKLKPPSTYNEDYSCRSKRRKRVLADVIKKFMLTFECDNLISNLLLHINICKEFYLQNSTPADLTEVKWLFIAYTFILLNFGEL